MASFQPAYPENASWDEAIGVLLEDPDDRQVIDLLTKDLREYGGFYEPITVSVEEGYIANGMHRVTAAYLYDPDMMIEYQDLPYLKDEPMEFLVTFIAAEDELELENCYNTLRSIRLHCSLWVTADVMYGSGTDYEITWGVNPDRVGHDDRRRLTSKVNEVLSRSHPSFKGEVRTGTYVI